MKTYWSQYIHVAVKKMEQLLIRQFRLKKVFDLDRVAIRTATPA